jgi:hypothetical protein
MHAQQKTCPHSVAVLAVRSSKQSVHVRPARIGEATDDMSIQVCTSSSARGATSASTSGVGNRRDDTGASSMYVSPTRSGGARALPLSDLIRGTPEGK